MCSRNQGHILQLLWLTFNLCTQVIITGAGQVQPTGHMDVSVHCLVEKKLCVQYTIFPPFTITDESIIHRGNSDASVL